MNIIFKWSKRPLHVLLSSLGVLLITGLFVARQTAPVDHVPIGTIQIQNLSQGANQTSHFKETSTDFTQQKPSLHVATERDARVETLLKPAGQMGRSIENPGELDQLSLLLAEELTPSDANLLRQVAMDPARSHNQRFFAVFLLAQRAADFAPELKEIAISEVAVMRQKTAPHTLDQLNQAFELSLRLQALIGLDQQNESGQKNQALFAEIRARAPHRLIARLAAIGERGSLEHRSLMGKFIDQKLQGALDATSRN